MMSVKKLIEVLSNEVKPADRENAKIEIWEGNQAYEIESMSGFSIDPNIVINIKKVSNKPAFSVSHVKKEVHVKKV